MNLDRIIAVRNNKTVYRDGDRCLKVFIKDYPMSAVFREAANQALFFELGLPVPRIFEVTSVDGRWAIVSEYIKGKTAKELIKDSPEEVLNAFVELQHSMHKSKTPYLPKAREKFQGIFADTRLTDAAAKALHMAESAFSEEGAVCHGDFVLGNVIVDRNGDFFITDCRHAFSGAAELDAALSFAGMLSEDAPLARAYLSRFCGQEDGLLERVGAFVPAAAAIQMTNTTLDRRFLFEELIKGTAPLI